MTLLALREGAEAESPKKGPDATPELTQEQDAVTARVSAVLEQEKLPLEHILRQFPEHLHGMLSQILEQVHDPHATKDTIGSSGVPLETEEERIHFLKKWSEDFSSWMSHHAPTVPSYGELASIAKNPAQQAQLEQLYVDRFRRTPYQLLKLHTGEEVRGYPTEETLGQGGFKQWEKVFYTTAKNTTSIAALGEMRKNTQISRIQKQWKAAKQAKQEAQEHYEETKMMVDDGLLDPEDLFEAEETWEDCKAEEEEAKQLFIKAKVRKEREEKLFIYERNVLDHIQKLPGEGKEHLVTPLGHSNNGGAILMQYIEGIEGSRDFADLLSSGKLSEAEVTEVLKQVVAGLEFLHQHGLVHFDLKPENIFVERTAEGAIKGYVGDLTPSHVEDPELNMWNKVGAVVSTPSFVPRTMVQAMKHKEGEQVRFTPDRYADLYALMMILNQLNSSYTTTEGDVDQGYNALYTPLHQQIKTTLQSAEHGNVWKQLEDITPRYHTPAEYDTTILKRIQQGLAQLPTSQPTQHE